MKLQPTLSWKTWVFAGLSILVVVIGFKSYHDRATPSMSGESPNPGSSAPLSEVPVETIHAQKGGMARTTTQPGSAQAFESVQRYAQISGFLKSQSVDIGDRVKTDQILAQIDVPELEKQVQRYKAGVEQAHAHVEQMKARVISAEADKRAAEAAVRQAKASWNSAKAWTKFRTRQLRRMQDLFKLKSIDERLVDESQDNYEAAVEKENAADASIHAAEAQLAAAQAKIELAKADQAAADSEVKVAQAEVEKAQVMVGFATIKAPFDGVITRRTSFPGDFVRAATEGGEQHPLFSIQRTDLYRVVVQIPDRDVPYCDQGDAADIEFDALPGKKFHGKVSRISHSEDPQTRLMHVEIDLPNPTGQIRDGMYGRASILLEKTDLLTLPSSCLVGRAGDGRGGVYVVRAGQARLTPVQIAQDNGLQVAIVSGVTVEDEVILHPSANLQDGTPVLVNHRDSHASIALPR